MGLKKDKIDGLRFALLHHSMDQTDIILYSQYTFIYVIIIDSALFIKRHMIQV